MPLESVALSQNPPLPPASADPAPKVSGWDWSILPDPATRLAGHHKLFLPNLHTAMVTSTQLCQ